MQQGPRYDPSQLVADDKHINLDLFFGSLASELSSKARRVRHLLGAVHWGSDGAYKERLVRDALKRAVPGGLRVGEGFIVGTRLDPRFLLPGEVSDLEEAASHTPEYVLSRQTDVLVYDDREHAPVFSDGDFTIALAPTVRVALEVKSAWSAKTLREAYCNLVRSHALSEGSRHRILSAPIFTAMVSFEKGVGRKPLWRVLCAGYAWRTGVQSWSFDQLEKRNGAETAIAATSRLPAAVPRMTVALRDRWIGVASFRAAAGLHIPVYEFFATKVKVDSGAVANHALHSLFDELLGFIEWDRRSHGETTRSELAAQTARAFRGTRHKFKSLGKPVSLIVADDAVRRAFPDVEFPTWT